MVTSGSSGMMHQQCGCHNAACVCCWLPRSYLSAKFHIVVLLSLLLVVSHSAPATFHPGGLLGISAPNTTFAPTNATGNEVPDPVPPSNMSQLMDKAWMVAAWKVWNVVIGLPTGGYPNANTVSTGQWGLVAYFTWTSGFWPGVLWYLYGEAVRTKSAATTGWRTWADVWTLGMAQTQEEWTNGPQYHDMGFMYFNSFWPRYRLLKDNTSLSQLIAATEELARRWNGKVQAMYSWSWPRAPGFGVIVDSMMNIPMLVVMAGQPGGNATWTDLAVRHARTVMKNHVREDGTTFQYVSFNATTGERLQRITVVGYNDSSVWSRGQAWGMYGFASMYKLTGEPEFLNTSGRLSEWFWDHLPDDLVPYWDFRDPTVSTNPKAVLRDSSAGAIAACAMLMLAEEEEDSNVRAEWAQRAAQMIQALLRECVPLIASKFDSQGIPILVENPTNKPITTPVSIMTADIRRPRQVPVGRQGTIYGDYYLLEAMTRCRSNQLCLNAALQ